MLYSKLLKHSKISAPGFGRDGLILYRISLSTSNPAPGREGKGTEYIAR